MLEFIKFVTGLIEDGKNAWIIFIALVIGGIINSKAIYELWDTFSKRKSTRIRDFLGEKGATGKTQEILQEELNSELFQYTKGIKAEKYLREEIIYLNELSHGQVRYLDFKRANRFLTIQENGKLDIRKFNPLDRLWYWLNIILSFSFYIFFALTNLIVFLPIPLKIDWRIQIVMIVYTIFFLACSIFTLSQALSFSTAKEIKKIIYKLSYENPLKRKELQTNNDFKITPSEVEKQAAKQGFESHFDEITLSYPVGTDNQLIETDAQGVMRIAKTRITLDTVVTAFLEGCTPEEIGEQYPSLQLSDIYFVIGYYLKHRNEVHAYLAERQRQADAIQQEAEQRFDPIGIRERLLARRNQSR